ncbi:hypothetical protein I302_101073 [Kwoniella bestiolae CBS 10118]|uniref:RRM domain-containing protein n=1 Tax=Kwoniella bestiolae CBS 10118 TaxID=1296100 RepID=A0A1B9G6Z7_9TREE|nr:hypothetical protein I302_04449 [Kwoniella bestiolae CBS 10118]OCF26760.1 hypothetical protein I302_04449 [Kwoniella bestiolae CBS 10118]
MKRPRSSSPSSSHRPHTKPRLTGSNLQPLPSAAPRRYPHSTPAPSSIRGYSTFHPSSNEQLVAGGEDDYSVPGGIESSSSSSTSQITQDVSLPLAPHTTTDVTHSPTPPNTEEAEYIVVDKHSLRPLLGWTTYKRLNRQTGLFEDHLVGVSETNVQMIGLDLRAFQGMGEMKLYLWSKLKPCGKITSIIVFREYEARQQYTAQVDFEDRDSALRALAILGGYWYNFAWQSLRISRRAYNHSLWGIVKSSEVSELQSRLLASDRRNVRYPRHLERSYGDQFLTNYDLPMAHFNPENYRSFNDLSEEYTPETITLDTNREQDQEDTRSPTSSPSNRSESFPLTLKRGEIHRRLLMEKNKVKEHVHPELAGLVGYNWQTGGLESLKEEEDQGMEVDEEYTYRDGFDGGGEADEDAEGWMELVEDSWGEM